MKKLILLIYFILQVTGILFSQTFELGNSAACCSFPVQSIALNPKPKNNFEFASSFGCKIKLWSFCSCFHNTKNLIGHKDNVTSILFSPNGDLLASGSKDYTVKIWNLILCKEIHTLKSHEKPVNQVVFNSSGDILASCGEDGKIILWNVRTGNKIKQLSVGDISVNSIAFSYDDKYLVSGQEDNTIYFWNISSGEILSKINIHSASVTCVSFMPNSYNTISGSEDNTIKIFDFKTNKVITTFIGHNKPITSISFAKDSQKRQIIISASRDKTIRFWDVEKGNEVTSINDEEEITNSLAASIDTIHPYHNIFISGSDDKTIKFWSLTNKKKIAELIVIQDSAFILKTPDHYFLASRNAYSLLTFEPNNPNSPSEFVEIQFNRPDIVLGRLNICDTNIIKLFYGAYQKRLEYLKINETMFSNDFHWPEVSIKEKDSLPITTNDKQITLRINAIDTKYKLDRINVWINEVPVFGIDGIDLRAFNIDSIEKKITLELSNGRNVIEISALNEKGAESKKQCIEIFYTGDNTPENLYIISIGCSEYKDNKYNLKYAASDANKIVNTFKAQNGFENIYSFLITDSLSKKDNIFSVKKELLKSKVDDEVIFYVSGHGVLDKNYDFYFAPYNMNFENPADHGILYDDLEGLLDSIPARKKILLMDACHSGELDKDQIEIKDTSLILINVVKGINNKGFTYYDLIKSYFPDRENTNGINILSSSTGTGYALESPEFNSGLFTYSIISALKDIKTDINNDGKISLSEFASSVVSETNKLSNGAQISTLRSHIKNDFIVYRPSEQHDTKPPKIMIIEPLKTRGTQIMALDENFVKIKGFAYDDSKIKILKINGEIVTFDTLNGQFENMISLNEGENNINISAEDIFGNRAEENIQIIFKGKDLSEFGTYYAFLIGESDYQNKALDLFYPVDDAHKFKSILVSKYLFDSINVVLLENPNRKKILSEFRYFREKLTENDNLLIFRNYGLIGYSSF